MNSSSTGHAAVTDLDQGKGSSHEAKIDVEKQCAVSLPNGARCARGLTCKRHGMSAKRAVPGRSAPFDQLLATYQRDN
ncbi:hypothetical protein KCU67_g8779, partial [Aureobasidium melanogenum]